MTPLEFREHLDIHKTRMNGLSCGEESMTIYSAVLIGCQRVTDRQTDRLTDVQPISITSFSIADARKNHWFFPPLVSFCVCVFFKLSQFVIGFAILCLCVLFGSCLVVSTSAIDCLKTLIPEMTWLLRVECDVTWISAHSLIYLRWVAFKGHLNDISRTNRSIRHQTKLIRKQKPVFLLLYSNCSKLFCKT